VSEWLVCTLSKSALFIWIGGELRAFMETKDPEWIFENPEKSTQVNAQACLATTMSSIMSSSSYSLSLCSALQMQPSLLLHGQNKLLSVFAPIATPAGGTVCLSFLSFSYHGCLPENLLVELFMSVGLFSSIILPCLYPCPLHVVTNLPSLPYGATL
jgi:hypothetical protein